ncbi:FHA domain-containing protein [Haloferax gibbonsii ATCC 33959]|uniref:FHA domain-containing protein n=1 Tax=Haloferax gibbonsii (strain ATCC 33959 / DSM 4427 / JCM 8863 / NBRC 102184 / NCIMB 2188 / Ma 2.38) TaxID=1227459 RepID=M0HQZ2_HALGM|nr:FHA domain-containing protein [Haloferax gibbonsii ATCC 33959]
MRPDCDETFDGAKHGGSCPECGTPHPDVTQNTNSGDSNGGGGGGEQTTPTAPEIACPDPSCGGVISQGEGFCSDCGSGRDEEFSDSLTCPNGHEVDQSDQFCSTCGEQVDTGGSNGGDTAPSVALAIGSSEYGVITDGQNTVNDDQKSPDVFGTDARRAAQQQGVDQNTALQIHRDYLAFRVDGDTCYVENQGRNPTRYNGDDFPQGEERELADGDTIELGAGAVTAEVVMKN